MTSFIRLLRGLALAVENYGDEGDDILRAIAELFRLQISGYPIEDVHLLEEHSSKLAEVVHIISEKYPLGLAILASGVNPPNSSGSLSNSLKEWTRLTMQIPPMSLKRLSRLF